MRYRKYINAGLFILVFLLIVSVSLAGATTPKPLVPNLPQGWSEIDPAVVYPNFQYNGLTPACSNCPTCTSDKFTFFVKKGKINKLVIYFQGGGACWDTMNCLYATTYNTQETETVDVLNNMKGIFDTDPTKPNPFKDWYVVYLPYCTGDLFWGAKDNPYLNVKNHPEYGYYTIQHRGFVNFQVVLKWVKDNFRLPEEVFVTGISAGGYGAIVNYPYIREAFPLTRVYVLGDAANAVTGDDFNDKAKEVWNVQLPAWVLGNDISLLNAEKVYTQIAARYPLMKFAQYTTAYDWQQVSFYHLQLDDNVANYPGGYIFPTADTVYNDEVNNGWHDQMIIYVHGTAATAPNYRYYIGAGDIHTILTTDKFYTETSAGGVSFAQWVKSMVDNPFGFFGGPLEGIWKNVEAQ